MNIALKTSVLFKGLSEEEIANILECYPNTLKTFEKKEFIFRQNDTCNKLMLVVEGLVECHMVESSGKLIVVGQLEPGQLLAPAFLFSEINKVPVTTVAVEETKILYLKKEIALQMMQENIVVLQNFSQIISNRSFFLSQKVKFHALLPLKNKIANYLLSEYERQNSLEIKITHTQQELADRFAVARPSFARTLSEMEKEGIIKVDNRQLIIKNLAELKLLSE